MFLKVALLVGLTIPEICRCDETSLFGDVFVTVTTLSGPDGEAIVDSVYLRPGHTAFETAESFCRKKDLDQAYSKSGLNPLHDNKCVLPITYELQKSSRSLCFKNPKPILSFLIDITDESTTRSEEVRFCAGQSAFDASVAFCREHIENEVLIGECQAQIETILSSKLNTLNDDAITIASGTSAKVHIDTEVKKTQASTIETVPSSSSRYSQDSSSHVETRFPTLGLLILASLGLVLYMYSPIKPTLKANTTKSTDNKSPKQLRTKKDYKESSGKMSKLSRAKLLPSPTLKHMVESAPTPTASHSFSKNIEKESSLEPSTLHITNEIEGSKHRTTGLGGAQEFRDPITQLDASQYSQASPSRTLKDMLQHSSANDISKLTIPPAIQRLKESPLPSTSSPQRMLSVSEVEAQLASSEFQKIDEAVKEAVENAIQECEASFQREKLQFQVRINQAEATCVSMKEAQDANLEALRVANLKVEDLNQKLEICQLELKAAMTTIAQTQSDAKAQDHISYQLVQSLQKRAEVAERDLAMLQEKWSHPMESHSSAVSVFSHVSHRIGSAASSVTSDDDQVSLRSSVSYTNIVGSAASSVSGDDDHHRISSPVFSPELETKHAETVTPTTPSTNTSTTIVPVSSKGSGEKKKKLSQRARKARRQQYQQMLQQQKEVEEEEDHTDETEVPKSQSAGKDALHSQYSSQSASSMRTSGEEGSLLELVNEATQESRNKKESNHELVKHQDRKKWGDSTDEEDDIPSSFTNSCQDGDLKHPRPSTPIAQAVDDEALSDVQLTHFADVVLDDSAAKELEREESRDETSILEKGAEDFTISEKNEHVNSLNGDTEREQEEDEDDYDGSMIIIGHSFDKHNNIQFEVRWQAEGEAEDFWFTREELLSHHKEAVLEYERSML